LLKAHLAVGIKTAATGSSSAELMGEGKAGGKRQKVAPKFAHPDSSSQAWLSLGGRPSIEESVID